MFTFTARPDQGDPITFESDSRDVAAWERTTKGATMGSLAADNGAGLSFTALYKIAWFAARRLALIPQDMTAAAFEREFAIDIEGKDDEDAEDEVAAEGEGDALEP